MIRIERADLMRFGREVLIICGAAVLISFTPAAVDRLKSLFAASPDYGFKQEKPSAAIDLPIAVRGIVNEGAPASLVLIVSPTCRYCLASSGFYRQLASAAKDSSTPVIVAVPDVKEAAWFLKQAGLDQAKVAPWADFNFSVEGTPTLLAVDEGAHIKRMWSGSLTERRETEVLQILKNPALLKTIPPLLSDDANLNAETLDQLVRQGEKIALLDVRERPEFQLGHTAKAANIPLIELPARIQYELSPDTMVVVDCSRLSEKLCRMARDRLTEHDFKRIAALNGDTVSVNTCKITPTL